MSNIRLLFIYIFLYQPIQGKVKLGIDVLEENNFSIIKNKKVGLIINHTSINSNWRSTIEIIAESNVCELVAIFTPEHGFDGKLDEYINYGDNLIYNVPVYSLYGETLRPEKRMIRNIDYLIFDILDIGTRFYTYIGTMKYCMEVANENNIGFIVLDRPNPINGIDISGPMLKNINVFGLAGVHNLPIRHGMTPGELALLFKADEKMQLNLNIIKMEGWKREMWFDETGLPWVNPSPNIRNMNQASLYPGLGLFERLNVANKRGLPSPFEMIGAPWINAYDFVNSLNKYNLPGVNFTPIKFSPEEHKYSNELCEGIYITITDREKLEPVKLGFIIIITLYKMYPEEFDINKLWHITRSKGLIQEIKNDPSIAELIRYWNNDLDIFRNKRGQYLLYP
ncbi:uncharacterized protein METZ01_LOCUS77382 [marine metagenome]|uniref:DUF1343 domain-containing protein n=1 Tax=marine metagenome TaxID=408172 RepID=A0A381UAD1_9ZZZZ